MKILLVEDDPALARALQRSLEMHGQLVDWIDDGAQALAWMGSERFDLVVLDLGLPNMDGMALLREARARGQDMPVLIITARDAVPDRVAGLNSGADDYLVKPFELDEFLARVRALYRRAQGRASDTVELGALRYAAGQRELRCQDELIGLTPRETALLDVLVQHLGAVVTKQQIGDSLFSIDNNAQLSAVEVYVHRLRKQLAPHGLQIRTVRGLGYMLEKPE
ncbi:MAG: response regulator [Granulosicoccaceae bacterium]